MGLAIQLQHQLYLRDPQQTELGRKIIEHGILLIDALGFEDFTFKKLALKISSTEASIYRYFENKHRLLMYLTAWYWNWTEYRMDLLTHPSQSAEEKIRWCLRVLTEEKKFDPAFEFVNEEALYRIVLNEQDKTYLTKWVDEDNKSGLFGGYKSICKKLSDLIRAYNPNYPHPNALVSTIMLASLQQVFFAQHLPSLTSFKGNVHSELYVFVRQLVFAAIKKS